jgi:WD40 repeat protein
MLKNGLTLVVIILFVAGCTPSPTATPAAATGTATPVSQSTATATLLPLPSLTPTVTPVPRFTKQCFPVGDQIVSLKDVASAGTILFDVPDSMLLRDTQTGVEHKLPAIDYGGYGNFQISPNRKMLALMEEFMNADRTAPTNYTLWVVDARAKLLVKISLKRADIGDIRWLDNERLILTTGKYDTLLVLNPFTGKQQLVSNELPDLDTTFYPWLMWRVEYSPDLEWAVYYYQEPNQGGHSVSGSIARDVVTKQNLWKSSGGYVDKPVWSPDGQEVAVTSAEDGQLYLIKRPGPANAIMDDSMAAHKASAPAWSPDGHFIAFWNFDNLIIYDRQTDRLVDTCILNHSGAPPEAAVWSPDSQQVIVNQGTSQPDLVDLQKMSAYKIEHAPNNKVLVWMNSLP